MNSRANDDFQMAIIPTFISFRRFAAADQTFEQGQGRAQPLCGGNGPRCFLTLTWPLPKIQGEERF